jgi:hypothetical protein
MYNIFEIVIVYFLAFCLAAIVLTGLIYGAYKLVEYFQDINDLTDVLFTVAITIAYIIIILTLMIIINETCVKGVFFHPSLWR